MTVLALLMIMIGVAAVVVGVRTGSGRDRAATSYSWGSWGARERRLLTEDGLILLGVAGCFFLALWALLEFQVAIAFLLGVLSGVAVLLISGPLGAAEEADDSASIVAFGIGAISVGVLSAVYLRVADVHVLLSYAAGLCFASFALALLVRTDQDGPESSGGGAVRRAGQALQSVEDCVALTAAAAAVTVASAANYFVDVGAPVSAVLGFFGLIVLARIVAGRAELVLSEEGSSDRKLRAGLFGGLCLIGTAMIYALIGSPTLADSATLSFGVLLGLALSLSLVTSGLDRLTELLGAGDQTAGMWGLCLAAIGGAAAMWAQGPYGVAIAGLGVAASIVLLGDHSSTGAAPAIRFGMLRGFFSVALFAVLACAIDRDVVAATRGLPNPVWPALGLLLGTAIYQVIAGGWGVSSKDGAGTERNASLIATGIWPAIWVGVTSLFLACILGRQVLAGVVLGIGVAGAFAEVRAGRLGGGEGARACGSVELSNVELSNVELSNVELSNVELSEKRKIVSTLAKLFALLAIIVGGTW